MYEIEKLNFRDTVKVQGIGENIFRNYRIYLEPQKVYEQYFYYGIEAKEEALEGIVFLVNQNQSIENSEDKLEGTIKESTKLLQQFYRFVSLNDEDRISNFYKIEKERNIEKDLENKIKRRLEELQETNDDYIFISNSDRSKYRVSDYEIRKIKENQEVENKVRRIVKKARYEGVNLEKSEGEIYEEERKKYFSTKKLKIIGDKIHYSTRERFRYAHFPEYSMDDNPQPYILRHWTEDIYDILNYLRKLESTDKVEYYRVWINTRIQRLKNRINYQTDEKKEQMQQEIQALEEIEKKLEIIKQKRNGKKLEERD